jgi:hypothetical protein
MPFEIGDVVKIVKNTSRHQFRIGERVMIRSVHFAGQPGEHYTCWDLDNKDWWRVAQEEIAPSQNAQYAV